MRYLVDTNVYLELFLKRENMESALSFFKTAAIKHDETYVTSLSIRDIGYVVARHLHERKTARLLQLKVYEMTTKVIPISADSAISSLYKNTGDFEDCLQAHAAEEAMCDAIITYNKKDFTFSSIPVFTPDELIRYRGE